MRRIRTASFVSLDGVMQAPGGPDEDTTGGFAFGGWIVPFASDQTGSLMGKAMGENYDLLLGRRTYEIFSAYWPRVDNEIARTFNAITKYVVAGPETPMHWANSHRLEGDPVEAIRTLKQTEGRDLLVQGSSKVIHTLLAADLIDRMTLLTYPVVLGAGKRLFDAGSRPRAWTMTGTQHTATGVVVSTFERGGAPQVGSFAEIAPDAREMARRERWAREA